MPDETGTETTRSDIPRADDSLFGDAADDAPAAEAEEQDSAEETEQGQDDPGPAEEQADAGEDVPANELKVVVAIKGSRATIGVQKPSADPHIESFDDLDELALTQEVPAVVERARWEESPKHPAYERPAPPARLRSRRQQGTAQAANAEGETEAETQQQTLRLF